MIGHGHSQTLSPGQGQGHRYEGVRTQVKENPQI